MLFVLKNSWALLLGMMLLLLGNGMQGTLLGIRGAIEGFDASTMAWVMSAYYLGFLFGTRRVAVMIRRVGHVRVFSALASWVAAAFILYAVDPSPPLWIAMRLVVGFCFAGLYVVAESWLNEAATNETRGQALSLYMIAQMVGIISAQAVVNLADPAGYTLFIVMSVLVSVSFAPILLTVSAAPAYQTTQPMTLRQLFRISPLGCVGTFVLGGVYAAIFGMGAVFGTSKGLDVSQISVFVAAIYIGGLVCQFPIGWASDRMDRRILITGLTALGALMTPLVFFLPGNLPLLYATAFLIGGIANPLYSLLIAYTNDFLRHSDMAAASGGLLFIHGTGSIMGPFVIGALMTRFGADAYFLYLSALFALIAGYAGFRMTRRAAPPIAQTTAYAPVTPQTSPVALEVAQGVAIDRALDAEAVARP